MSAEEIQERGHSLDVRNPHTEAEHFGSLEKLRAELNRAEVEVTAVRDQLKKVLTEALLR